MATVNQQIATAKLAAQLDMLDQQRTEPAFYSAESIAQRLAAARLASAARKSEGGE